MKAIRIHEYGPEEKLVYEDVPAPEPGPGQVRIAVRAAGVHLLADGDDRYDIVLRPDGTARLRKVVDGAAAELASGPVPDFELDDADRMQAELDLRGGVPRIALWVNGDPIFEYTDRRDPLLQGTTGLVLDDAGTSERVTAVFDDFALCQAKDA